MAAPAGNSITTTDGKVYPYSATAAVPKPAGWIPGVGANNDVKVTVTLGTDYMAVAGVQVYLCVVAGLQYFSFLVSDGAVFVATGFSFFARNNTPVAVSMEYVAQTGLPVAQTEGPVTTANYTPAVPGPDNTGNNPVMPAPTYMSITAANP